MIHHRLGSLLFVALVGCAAGGGPPPATPTTAKDTTTAAKDDPCKQLPECPAQCPEPVGSMAGRACGSEGLRCGDESIVCACKDGGWSCQPFEKPENMIASCPKSCNDA